MKNLGATDMHGRLTVGGYGADYMNRLGGAAAPAQARERHRLPAGRRDLCRRGTQPADDQPRHPADGDGAGRATSCSGAADRETWRHARAGDPGKPA